MGAVRRLLAALVTWVRIKDGIKPDAFMMAVLAFLRGYRKIIA
jgi:hypothetical protein